MGNENLIADKIYRQIMAIRDSGACNMFDLPRVQEEAYKMGFYELVVFLNEHKKECQFNPQLQEQTDAFEENKRLRRELAEKEKEIAFLKKAAAFFAKEIE
jgi:transposase-like protein